MSSFKRFTKSQTARLLYINLCASLTLSAASIIEKIPPLQPVSIAYIKSAAPYAGKQVLWKIFTYTIDESNGTYTAVGDTITDSGDSVKVLLIKYSSKYTFYKVFASSGNERDSLLLQAFSKGSMQKYLFTSKLYPLKKIPVYLYLPATISTRSLLVAAMHGLDRNAISYGMAWMDYAAANNKIVFAPEFSTADWSGDAYTQGNMFTGNDGGGTLNPRERWAFTMVSEIERELVNGFWLKDSSYTLWGHSAGAQFVHRMMIFAFDPLIRRAISANAGWYTAPDSAIVFPWGVKHSLLSVTPQLLTDFVSREMVIMRGTADTVRDANLNVDPLSDAQGKNRYQRAGYFFQKGKDVGPKFQWKLIDVVGSGHDFQKMAVAAGHYISSLTGVERFSNVIPSRPTLQCYPNPFNPSTEIVFSVQTASHITITVYNILGQKVKTVVDGFMRPGEYRNRFDGTSLSNGIYLCMLRSDIGNSTIKLLLVK